MKEITYNKKPGTILTYSGIWIDPLHPAEDQILMEDIAHSLSMMCRANGHFRTFHSVAQHCIECYEEARARGLSEDIQKFCFLHDGAEAYMGDFVSPVKYRMDQYREAEALLLAMIYKKFTGRIPDKEEEAVVKMIDHTLLYYEFDALMGLPIGQKPDMPLLSVQHFEERSWREVEKEYLMLFSSFSLSL